MQFVKPISFQEALDLIGDKSPIGAMLSSSEWADVPVALRQRAMFSAEVENARFLQRAQDSLGDFLDANKTDSPNGPMLATGSRAAFVQQLREFAIAEGMGPLESDQGQATSDLQDITSERRLGLIFDTQTRQAQDYGYWRQGQDADVLNEFPAQRFIRVMDVKEPRTSHTQFEDQVYLKTDPIWANVINEDFHVPWGPWAWGCGHDVEDVDREEAVSLGLIDESQRVEPDVQNFNENLQASTRGLDPDLLEKLKSDFGDQIKIEGESMQWVYAGQEGPAIDLTKPLPFPTASVATENPGGSQMALPETSTLDPESSPVSDALAVNVRGGLRTAVNTALKAIDEVHDDGALPEIPIHSKPSPNAMGQFFPVMDASGLIKAESIGVSSHGTWPALTTIHEVGHFLDLEAIGETGKFATRTADPGMAEVLAAAEKTSAIQALRRTAIHARIGSREEYLSNYFLRPSEIWARAYAQFVAEESGDATLKVELAKALDEGTMRQWTTEDFKPISDAIKTMFKGLGWL